MKIVRRIAWVTVGFTYFLIALGGTVRVSDSGLSCPDWPFCNGQAYYAGTYHTFLEQFHRFTAATVGILIVLLFIGVLFSSIIRNVYGYDQTLASAALYEANAAHYADTVAIGLVLTGLILVLMGGVSLLQLQSGGIRMRFRSAA